VRLNEQRKGDARRGGDREMTERWPSRPRVEDRRERRAPSNAQQRNADDQIGKVVTERRAEEPCLRDLEEKRGGRDEEDRGHLRRQAALRRVGEHPPNAIASFSGDRYQFGDNRPR
jgi:hypothetical protein